MDSSRTTIVLVTTVSRGDGRGHTKYKHTENTMPSTIDGAEFTEVPTARSPEEKTSKEGGVERVRACVNAAPQHRSYGKNLNFLKIGSKPRKIDGERKEENRKRNRT